MSDYQPVPLPSIAQEFGTAAQVIAALKEAADVQNQNVPAQKHNLFARQANAKLKKWMIVTYPSMGSKERNNRYFRPHEIKLKPLTYPTPEAKRIIDLETAHRLACTRRHPKIWMARVIQLPFHERPLLARIIWWDWFADRISSERVSDFDLYLLRNTEPIDITNKRLEEALVFCGYSPHQAFRRASGAESVSADEKGEGELQP